MNDSYDVVVIGAGPAGSVAAYRAATLGASVLLVDKASFPRVKVCGCCINARALAVFDRLGLGRRRGARRAFSHLRWKSTGCARVSMSPAPSS